MDFIIKFSLKNRLLIIAAAVIIAIAGIYTTLKTDVDVFPDLNAPTVVVMTEAGGMATEEVEQLVTFPIETAMNGSTGVRRVRSQSTNGFSVVWVEFDWDTDVYLARQIVSEKLAGITEQMPEGVSTPVMGPQSSILGEMMIISLTSDTTSLLDLRTMADWNIRPRLLSINGVAQVSVHGGDIKEYQILLSPNKMKHYGVTVQEVMEATRGMNRNQNGGVVYQYGNEYIVRGITSTNDIDRIEACLVKKSGDTMITLADIADVSVGAQQPKLGVASEKGHPAVLLTVTKQPHTGTIGLTNEVDRSIEELKAQLPKDVHVSTDIFRQADFIDNAIGNVKKSLIEGAFFVALVLFLFLRNWRTTCISLVTIPLSFLITIIILHLLGISINTMTLGGLAIAIGSLVDDAIVDVENVVRRAPLLLPRGGGNANSQDYEKVAQEAELSQKASPRGGWVGAVFQASREVRIPILNSTLIIVVSFIPLFFLDGMEGRMLIPLGIAFITALFASTLVALTLTPVLCSYMQPLSSNPSPRRGRASHRLFFLRKLDEWGAKASEWFKICLTKFLLNSQKYKSPFPYGGKGMAFGLAIGLGIGAAFLTLGSSFLPPFNEGSLTINISSLPGISLEESDAIGRRAEKLLLEVPEIQTVARKTGRAELDEHALGVNVSEIEAPFELKDRSHQEMIDDVRERLSILVGANIEIGQPISHRIDAMLSGTQASIAIKLFGNDLNRLFTIGNQVKEAIEDVDGIADLNVEQQIERPELKITPRREVLARNGITMPQFNEFLAVNLAGEKISQVYENGKAFNLVIKGLGSPRNNLDNPRNNLGNPRNNLGNPRNTLDNPRNNLDNPSHSLDNPSHSLGNPLESIANLPLCSAAAPTTTDGSETGGTTVTLSDIADVVSSAGPNTINRENCQRKIVISANTSGRDLGSVVADIRERIDEEITLPEGYRIEYGGQFESQQSASRTLALACIVSIMVIFMLLYMQFRDVKLSAIILINLPLALIGSVVALVLTTGEVSIPAIIGFISLFGIATRNGMLLIEEMKSPTPNPSPMERDNVDRAVSAVMSRLRPILMTALTSALALIPLALGSELPGNEIQSPMAKVILGGLISATLLNLFVTPLLYMWMKKKDPLPHPLSH